MNHEVPTSMRQTSTISSPETRMKTCVGCGATVARRDCHRNRYGEYVCRTCQEAGIRFSPARSRVYRLTKLLRASRTWLVCLAVAVAVLATIYVLIDRVESASVAE
jgi:hypothetical protein